MSSVISLKFSNTSIDTSGQRSHENVLVMNKPPDFKKAMALLYFE